MVLLTFVQIFILQNKLMHHTQQITKVCVFFMHLVLIVSTDILDNVRQAPLKKQPPPRPAHPFCLASSKLQNVIVTTQPVTSSSASEEKSPPNSPTPNPPSSPSAKSPTTTISKQPLKKSTKSASLFESKLASGPSAVHDDQQIPVQSSEKLPELQDKSE